MTPIGIVHLAGELKTSVTSACPTMRLLFAGEDRPHRDIGIRRSITWQSTGGSLERKTAGSANAPAMNCLQHNDLKHVHAGAIIIPLKQQPRFESRAAKVSHSMVRIESD
jgi:hypothetical protein